ncbi:TetR/AcrR family transcriptional regulator [Glycomyces albidus]|uniref:TetR/AcrR family transcriptional regulator n=1 Tax=Glycomyces albidus TaxID=2656774 RepID=UPI002AD3FAC3|nr:TetR/AcrR family transcriptional regulator [Glycomyces albidus]
MSKTTRPRPRKRRSDAEHSAAAVLDAAVEVLGRQPDAKLEQVAEAAGVTRQTVYAHYPSRPLLVAAVVDRITAEAVTALDAAALDSGTSTGALLAWLEVTWRLFDRYPLLQHPSVTGMDRSDSDQHHAPVAERLERLIVNGQTAGEFDRDLSPAWLVSATVALGHAAGVEVAAGRMTAEEASESLRHSVLRVYGAGRA